MREIVSTRSGRKTRALARLAAIRRRRATVALDPNRGVALVVDFLAEETGPRECASSDRVIESRVSAAGAPSRWRTIGHPPPAVDALWVEASATPPEARTPVQRELLELSDVLTGELLAAREVILILRPAVPASLGAALRWLDLVSRVDLTFRLGADGASGLLGGRRAAIVALWHGPRGSEASSRLGDLVDGLRAIGLAVEEPSPLSSVRA